MPVSSGGPLKLAVPITVRVAPSTTANPYLQGSTPPEARSFASHEGDTASDTRKSRRPSPALSPAVRSNSSALLRSARSSAAENGRSDISAVYRHFQMTYNAHLPFASLS